MLAASTTGTIIAGVIGLLILLGLLYLGFRVVVVAIRLLVRLITWPFRALRTPPPIGAGSEYEAMIRAQPRGRTVTTGPRLPFPPPPPDAAVFRYRKGWSWTISLFVTFGLIGAVSYIAYAADGSSMHAQNVAGDVMIVLAVIFWLWSWRRGRFPIIRIGSQVPGERAEFEAWRAARHDADLADFQAWKAGREQVADEPTAPAKPSIDTF